MSRFRWIASDESFQMSRFRWIDPDESIQMSRFIWVDSYESIHLSRFLWVDTLTGVIDSTHWFDTLIRKQRLPTTCYWCCWFTTAKHAHLVLYFAIRVLCWGNFAAPPRSVNILVESGWFRAFFGPGGSGGLLELIFAVLQPLQKCRYPRRKWLV